MRKRYRKLVIGMLSMFMLFFTFPVQADLLEMDIGYMSQNQDTMESESEKTQEENNEVYRADSNVELKVSFDEYHYKFEGIVISYEENTFSNVQIAVWSEENGKDDLKWYTAEQYEDNIWYVQGNIGEHKRNTGKYFFHAYTIENGEYHFITSQQSYVDGITLKEEMQIIKEQMLGKFHVKIGEIVSPAEIESINVGVWGEENGQNDIRWYAGKKDEKGQWYVDVSCSNHKNETGKYVVHVYATDSRGVQSFVGGIRTDITYSFDNADINVEMNREQSGAEIRINGIPVGVGKLEVGIWSEANSQDDLKWYPMECKEDEGRVFVNIKNHKYNTGNYFAHIYCKINGKSHYIGGVKFNIGAIKKSEIKINSSDIQKGRIELQAIDVQGPVEIREVRAAVWTEKNGQDDLRWYSMEQKEYSWNAVISMENHYLELGNYYIHMYAKDARGVEQCIGTIVHKVEVKAEVKTEVNEGQTGAVISVDKTQLLAGMKEIRCAVWSEENGQDDLVWYTLGRNFKKEISIRNHKNGTGRYIVHVYAIPKSGQSWFIGGKDFEVKKISCDGVQVVEFNAQKKNFKIEVTNAQSPGIVSAVKVGIWSEANGQDDLNFYMAKKAGQSWYTEVDMYNHNFDSGIYYIHIYASDTRGTENFIGGLKSEFQLERANAEIQIKNKKENNSFSVVLSHDQVGKDVVSVEFAVWSRVNGQDDLRWYSAQKKTETQWEAHIYTANHKNNSGIYLVHAYGVKRDGSKYCLKTGQGSIMINWEPRVKKQTINIKGLNRDYNFLYISDTHIISLDGTESSEVKKLGESRIPYFVNFAGMNSEEQFPYWIEYANEHSVDGVLLGGDIVDYPSKANVNFFKENLNRLEVPYVYAFGNHDWQYPWDSSENYRRMFEGVIPNSGVASYQEFEDLVILSVDDSAFKVSADALPIIEQALTIGKPVILVMHVPLQTDSLLKKSMSIWGKAEMIGPDGYQPDENTRTFLEKIMKEDSPVQAIITGHVHTEDVSKINDRITQYVSNMAATGNGVVIRLQSEK